MYIVSTAHLMMCALLQKTACTNKLNNNKLIINTMIANANSNIDFLTLKNTSAADIIPRRLLIWLYVAVLTQPIFQSLVFWLVSKDILTTMTGFMLGVAMIIIWMSYDSGFFRALNRCFRKCKFYKGCHHKVHDIYNHLDSALHLFWVFIAPPLSAVAISLYAITSLLLTASSHFPQLSFLKHLIN